jgi:Flp pilus assembly pilin Flp
MRLRNQKGQGLIEYVILVAIIAVGTIIMVRKLQSTVTVNMANIVEGLQSNEGKRKHSFIRVDESDYRMKDFSNFMNGTTDRSDSN